MPWTSGDADRFKKGLSESQKSRWASIANSVLEQSGDESKAIRIANGAVTQPSGMVAAAKRRLQGGQSSGG